VDTIDRVRALLRLTLGDEAGAVEIAAHAVEASRGRRTRVFLARELIVLAAAQQRLGVAGWEEPMREALDIARRTGVRMIAKDARLFVRGTPDAADHEDGFGLTPREGEILDLVAEGATNAQIASALGVSLATVRKHLEHVYEKLHVSTRTAAVARYRAHQL
jgi:DNA-binding CsgD family transcriptional regulator